MESIDSDTFDFPLHADDRLTRIDYQLNVNIGEIELNIACVKNVADIHMDHSNICMKLSALTLGVIVNDDSTIGADISLGLFSVGYRTLQDRRHVDLLMVGVAAHKIIEKGHRQW